MDTDYLDNEMNSSEKEVNTILSRIREFNVCEVNNAIDNITSHDECLNLSQKLENLISDISDYNLINADYLNKKAFILGLALKCSKKLNEISYRELQQHLNHKDAELQMLKETLAALESKMPATAETYNNTTIKINKIKKSIKLSSKISGRKK
ncbi:hypothetical protein NPIL_433331 [Nephila pilipes]|uniref:Uncharacterized protein n=1 Tax=Nephila pilipes TaxID=299642 RepID=A0A8X6UU22_NEPPI|nr:hypothetical protein NPIL_433331 [Nephila pilipes]